MSFDPQAWQSGKPPNRQIVETEHDGTIIRVRAIWGRDGVLPHWESEDRGSMWEPFTFKQWRWPAFTSKEG